MNNRLEIDLLNLTENSSQLLAELLLRKRRNGRLVKHGQTFWVGLRRVSISHDIIIREKIPGIWRYDVLDNESCGSGKSGTVYKIISVLRPRNRDSSSELVVSQKQKRVYKIQKNAGINEYELMQRCPHLRARALFRGIPSYITMRQFPGVMLNDALNDERRKKPFTHIERYRLSVGLLKALKKQIHNNMICHRDIKPDNIFYNAETGEINILDLGISKLIGDDLDKRSRGNATFSPPEEFISTRTGEPITIDEYRVSIGMMSKSTIKADIRSMAEVIRLVWRDVDPIFFIENADHATLMKRRIHRNWRPDFKLFQGLGSMTGDEIIAITDQLARMTEFNPDDRPDLDSCIEFFDSAFLKYKLTKIPVQYHQSVVASHEMALSMASKLEKVEKLHDVSTQLMCESKSLNLDLNASAHKLIELLNQKLNYRYNVLAFEADKAFLGAGIDTGLPLREAISSLVAKSSLKVLFGLLFEEIDHLTDNPYAVVEFIETLDIGCLIGIPSKTALIDELHNIYENLTNRFDSLLQLYAEIEGAGNSYLLADADHFLKMIQRERMTVDAAKNVADHICRKQQKLTAEFRGFKL